MSHPVPHDPNRRPVVVITGSSGLIGAKLVERFVASHEVVGLDVTPPTEAPREGFQFVSVDLTQDEDVERVAHEVVRRVGADVASLIHLAAYYDFSGEPSDMYQKLTVEGTRRLLRSFRSAADLQQFVFSSTLLVMKPVEDEGERLTEDSPTLAKWDYPQSKLDAEAVIHEERGNVPSVSLRMAGVYDDTGNSLPIAQHIHRIWEKKLESVLFPGDVTHGQPYVHLEDLVEAFARVVARRRDLGEEEVFLIAEPSVLSYEELQDRLGRLIHGEEWPTLRIPGAVAKMGAWIKERLPGNEEFIKPWMIELADDHYPVDIAKAQTRLGWEPRHSLGETLPKIVDSLRQSPEEWFERHGIDTKV